MKDVSMWLAHLMCLGIQVGELSVSGASLMQLA